MPRRLASAHVHVVSVKRDVELPEGDLGPRELGNPSPQPLGERHAARVDADERHARKVGVSLDDLVRDPRQRLADRVGIEDGLGFRGLRSYGAVRVRLTFDSFPASRDRVKGVLIGARPYTGGRTATTTSHSTR
jgi:hypothetical protein